MVRHYRTHRPGLTLVELVTAMAIGLLTILTVGIVLAASQHNFVKAYNDANKGIEVDAFLTMVEYGITGRQSNKTDYHVYQLTGTTYVPATPDASGLAVGDAVEFRYWDVSIKVDPSIMDTTKTANSYRFFYLDGTKLKMDQGPYRVDQKPYPGAIDASGHKRDPVTTQTLSENVTYLRFNHTATNDPDGDGSVRMEAVFTDPCDNGTFITVKTATLLRNVWP